MLVVGCYDNRDALLEKLERSQPDLIVIDPAIDGHDGSSRTLERVRRASQRSRVVVMASAIEPSLARALVRYGVRGVMLRTSPSADAIAVLEQVLDGQGVFPSSVMEHLAAPDELGPLSARQREVLEHLAQGHSNEEIARRLFISRNTVKFHLRVIYERLGVHNRVEAARCLHDRAI
jgi:DNA-binding NarL/FixJ family response regulator